MIACEVAGWHNKLNAATITLDREFANVIRTNAGLEALQWFFRQPRYIKALLINGEPPQYSHPTVRRLFVSALCQLAPRFPDEHPSWLRLALSYIDRDSDNLVRIEAIKLCTIVADDGDEIAAVMGAGYSLKEFIQAALAVSEEYPLSTDGVGRVVLDAFRTFHHESETSADGSESEITDVLEELLEHTSPTVREGAAVCLGHISAWKLFEVLAQKINRTGHQWQAFPVREYLSAIDGATEELEEIYYGGMCPGMLQWIFDEDAEPERLVDEYNKLTDVLVPLVHILPASAAKVALLSLLDQLDPEGQSRYEQHRDRRTLPLPFD